MLTPADNFRDRRVICNLVLFGTYMVIIVLAILLWISFSINHSPQVLDRLVICQFALVYIVIAYQLSRRGHRYIAAYLLVLFYALLASGIVWIWGINTPIGILLLGLVIVLAGILLTARHALFAAVFAGLALVGVQMAILLHWHTPDTSWTSSQSSFGDIFGYCTIFGMLALVSWLYNREMERSLAQAKQAEAALLQQKATLKTRVKERTTQLRHAQLEEMRQMYRFAELGQLGATLLHDLANHLTALTLEIQGMQNKRHSKAITRAQDIIHYLEDIVDNTRERLQGHTQRRTFNIAQGINEVVRFLNYKASKAHVTIEWHPPTGMWTYTGDFVSLCQVIAIIISNAIDAYDTPHKDTLTDNHRVIVSLQQHGPHIIIKVGDWGKGVTKNNRKRLFKPFHSTKKSGLGLGLFIAKQTVETQFSGTLKLNPRSDYTEFIIKLPQPHER